MDAPSPDLSETVVAYNRRAAEYTAVLGDINATHPVDQDRIRRWATTTGGTICDLGCGPGHWTRFLHQAGTPVAGFDPSEEFTNIAQRRFPHLNFTCGTARDLPESSFDGVLAWYSLIHIDPEELDEELAHISRALIPGGSLLLGFFVGEDIESFDHAITPAWFYPLHLMGKRLEEAGFTIRSWNARRDEGARPHGDIEAVLLD